MEKLTLEEAIVHAKEVAEKNYRGAEFESIDSIDDDIKTNCIKCAEEHMQLVKWLEELKSYKDLEEQGLLVKLPDDLFKKVYRITYEYTECSKFGETVIDCENYNCNCDCDSEKKFYIVENNLQFMLFCNYYNELDKTVFLTREEAERKLKELENGSKK